MKHIQIYENFSLIEEKKTEKKRKKDIKWIQKAIETPGALHRSLDVPEGETIPMEKINSKIEELQKSAEGDKKLSKKERKLLRRLTLAKKLKTAIN